jgi:hypothetical protein
LKISGWLTPSGEFVKCELYEHLSVVVENPVFIAQVPEIDSLLQELYDCESYCQEMSEREGSGNAEWHRYEMLQDGMSCKIRCLLLDAGFIRVGEYKNSIHFEGRPNHLKSKHQMCVDFADSYGANAIFEPVRE